MAPHILVVEDSKALLELFQNLLEDEGYKVTLSPQILQREDQVLAIAPDLIILDVLFGEKEAGWQMLQMLKSHASTAAIPVIICSAAHRSVQRLEEYLATQKHVFVIKKPFETNQLLDTIAQTVEERTMHKQQ